VPTPTPRRFESCPLRVAQPDKHPNFSVVAERLKHIGWNMGPAGLVLPEAATHPYWGDGAPSRRMSGTSRQASFTVAPIVDSVPNRGDQSGLFWSRRRAATESLNGLQNAIRFSANRESSSCLRSRCSLGTVPDH